MIETFRKLFRPQPARPLPSVLPGERIYAVGDIHGCLELFDTLVAAIGQDDAARGTAETTIILLGDLVDRGNDSAGVIAAARALQAQRKVRILMGNHEEMFLRCFEDLELLRHFLRFGGRETILSYPVDVAQWNQTTLEEAQVLMNEVVPLADRHFMESFENTIVCGDYLFVHAGIDPGKPLEQQSVGTLRWIREPFLSHEGEHGHVVVHGHTITDEPVVRHNRIGIDTGAYASGKLTALGLEGTERWIIEAAQDDFGDISVKTRQA
jgi:serine/threonine protein phosphatase 1